MNRVSSGYVNDVKRFRSIDGLRGIAAMAVVLYHLSANLKHELSETFPFLLHNVFAYGYLGVPVFFVISGLVISLSMADVTVTRAYAFNFIIRRSLRLDPTYWAAIFFGILLIFAKNSLSGANEAIPSWGNIFAHMFYLQDVLQVRPLISVVFWTLCLEVQFYLFYLFSLWFSQKAFSEKNSFLSHQIIIVGLGLVSVLLDREYFSIFIPGLFISNWHYFLIGVLVANVFRGERASVAVMLVWLLYESLTCIYFGIKPYQIAGIAIALLLYALWIGSLIDGVFTSVVLQYLGRISYTLYLIHPDIGWKVISMARAHLGPEILQTYVLGVLGLGIIVSIIVAQLFHLLFELPSLRLANKLKMKKPVKNTAAIC